MLMRIILVVSGILAPIVAWAQTQTTQPVVAQVPMIIEPADADAFRDIVESTIPPRYNGALIRWYTAILQRQQAKQEEMMRNKGESLGAR